MTTPAESTPAAFAAATAPSLADPSATASPNHASPARPMTPAAIVRIKNLELRAKVVVEGFMAGLHRSPYHGFSVEFSDYRQYSPGDDLRYLDWKLLARADRKYIKRFEDETNLRCYLLVDFSHSMSYSSLSYSKSHYASTLAATLAYFLNRQRDAVGLLTFADQLLEIIPPRFRAGHLRRLMLGLERSTVGNASDLRRPLQQIAATVRKRGLVILISDFLAPIEALSRDLAALRAQGHEVLVLRVCDPAEVSFPFKSAVNFLDLESGQRRFIDPEIAAPEYRQRFAEHEAQIRTACENLGIHFFPLTSDQSLDAALFEVIQVRSFSGQGGGGRTQRNSGGGTQ